MKNSRQLIITAAIMLAFGLIISISGCENKNKEKQLYTCPMHPQVIQDHPGACPICGMTLVKLNPVQNPKTKNEGNKGEERADVTINPEQQQLIGVMTDTVKVISAKKEITMTGTVAYDPELYYAQQQYITEIKDINKIKEAGDDAEASLSLLDSARLKLTSLGLSEAQIKDLESKDAADKYLLTTEGGSNVWVYGQAYQADLSYIKRGEIAEITSELTGEKVFTGKVIGIDPVLDPDTRSVRIRILAQNSGAYLKPESYVDVKIRTAVGMSLAVPQEAVMDTGDREVAFVDIGNGVFEPRLVTTNGTAGKFVLINSGLKDGEKVVVNANFLIDSESRLKAGVK
jgi:Cu(I)/Ag(I) efflux system membrane fusion protein